MVYDEYAVSMPVPHKHFKDFLPEEFAHRMYVEAQTTPDHLWTTFERAGSYMQECVKLEHMPVATEFVNAMHSKLGHEWLSEITGIRNILGDPYIVGGGYSKSWKGHSLKVHSDFNWNDKLRLHRAASLIIYLTPGWEPEWKGQLQFWDNNKSHVVKQFECEYNSALLWDYHRRGFHGYPDPIDCPEDVHRTTFRLFFYYSDSEYKETDKPHRSLYWYDSDMEEPFDVPSRK